MRIEAGEFSVNPTTKAEHVGDGIFHIWQSDGDGGHEFVVFSLKDALVLESAIAGLGGIS